MPALTGDLASLARATIQGKGAEQPFPAALPTLPLQLAGKQIAITAGEDEDS